MVNEGDNADNCELARLCGRGRIGPVRVRIYVRFRMTEGSCRYCTVDRDS